MKVFKLISLALATVIVASMVTGCAAPASNVYQDPEGRFSIPLIGDWTQVETDGTYAQFVFADMPLYMNIIAVASDDIESGADMALRQIGIDPAALTEYKTAIVGQWDIVFYTLEGKEGEGVSVLARVKEETTYFIIATGDFELTDYPPDDVMKTIQGFTVTGEEVVLPTTVEEFEAFVNGVVEDMPPGLSVVIAQAGDIIYANGFGMADGPKGMAATPDTVYQWSSMAKIVTATAIMQLRDQGLIDLNAPVSDYLDYFPAQYPITVRQLLTHSAGLFEIEGFLIMNLALEGQPLPDPDLIARGYYEQFTAPIYEPGSASTYSNMNYVTLGQIVAQVSGQPYMEYAREHILAPLGMETTDFLYSSEAMIEEAAAGALPAAEAAALIATVDEIRGRGDGADFIREVDDNHAWMNRYSVFSPAGGGLIGPATDVIRFMQMHLNGGELDGVRILSPESVALMQEMQLSTTGGPLGYGLGWNIFEEGDHPYVEHNGGGTGSKTKIRLYTKDGFAIVVMSNADGWDRETVTNAAANVVFSMLGS